MKFVLNISTHSGDLAILEHDWEKARGILREERFDGYELYPVGNYEWDSIPCDLMIGVHLRFYPILQPFWFRDNRRLIEIFGDEATVSMFYGGLTRESLVENYRNQLSIAQRLGCAYVVFHLAQSEFEYIQHWRFPWDWRETIDMCADILNESLKDSVFNGELLLENLWWPGSFRAVLPEEIEYALSRVTYPRTGIVFDTGHMLNTNQDIHSEKEGIDFLIRHIRSLGELGKTIRGVHLTRSLSGEYVTQTRNSPAPPPSHGTFWERYHQAIEHVNRIDEHDPFEDTTIAGLFEVLKPEYVTYEFSYRSRQEWIDKIRRQRKAMFGVHP